MSESTEYRPENDPVMHPKHYMLFPDTEVIDLIAEVLSVEEFRGYCKGNILKYRLRAGEKGSATQDIEKANVYSSWLGVLQ